MTEARSGSTVHVHYTGSLADGSVFDSSNGRDPLAFTLGQNQVIPGFENAVAGMQVGEEKTVTIPAAEAYGPHRDELVLVVERSQLPEGLDPATGQQLQLSQGGQSYLVTVTDVSEQEVVLDANHPLAGRDLTFELRLVDVDQA